MNNLHTLTTLLAATGLLLLVGLGKPAADYYHMSQQSQKLERVRQQLSGPILIHQAIRGLSNQSLSNPDEIALWLDQLGQGISQTRGVLPSEVLDIFEESSTTIASRVSLVAKAMTYNISLDIFDHSLNSDIRQVRINATTEALVNLQHQLAALDASPSIATDNLVASSQIFINNLNTSPLPPETGLVSDLERLQDECQAFILEPLTSPQSISAMRELNQLIETLRKKEQLILGDLASDVGNP